MAWDLIHQTDFTGLADAPAVAAGVVLVDGWTDEAGNIWEVAGGRLKTSANAPTGFQSCFLTRLGDAAAQDHKMVISGFKLAADYNEVALGVMLRARGPWWNRFEYRCIITPGGTRFYSNQAGTIAGASDPVNWVSSYDPAHEYEATVYATGINPTTLGYSIRDVTLDVIVATDEVTDSAPDLQNDLGQVSLVLWQGNGLTATIKELSTYVFSGTVFSAYPLTKSAQDANGATLAQAGATGGVEPYTLALHRSIYTGFTPGPETLVDADATFPFEVPNPEVETYYKVVVTDANDAEVITDQLTLNSFLPALKIGFVGDSITSTERDGETPAEVCARLLSLLRTPKSVEVFNQALSGSTAAEWASTHIASVAAQLALDECDHVSVMLGTNDARPASAASAATFKTSLQAVCTALVGEGLTVVLHYPPFTTPDDGDPPSADAATNDRLFAYQAQIDSLVNGTTILQGDRLAFTFFGNNQDQLIDNLHPDAEGVQSLGMLWAWAIDRALNPSTETPNPDPEDVDPPVVLRVAAEKSGLQQSDVAQLTLT